MNDVNRREIYRYLGYRGSTPDAAVAEAVESCLEELRRVVTPRFVFRRYEIERIEEPAAPVSGGVLSEAGSSQEALGCRHMSESFIRGQMPAAQESEKDLETGGHPEQGAHPKQDTHPEQGAHPQQDTHPQAQLLQIAGMKIRSRSLSINLRGCYSVYLMAATLGIGPDRLIARASVNRMSRAVIYQAAAAAMIETWSDEVNSRIIQEAAKEGLFCRPRFSPGYGDFSLTYQSDFARILRIQKEIGVSLTESMLMMPSKSVTAVIGLSRRDEKCVLHGCEVCSKADGCAFSRMRGTGAGES